MSRALLKEINGVLTAGISDNIDAIKEKIKVELEKPETEPVAWAVVDDENKVCYASSSKSHAQLAAGNDRVEALYLSSAQQKPLSDDEITNGEYENNIVASCAFRLGIKFAEKSHGIGE